MDNYGNFTILDIITVMSFLVGVENMGLNKQQIHNKQDYGTILSTIMEQNEEIIRLLKEQQK